MKVDSNGRAFLFPSHEARHVLRRRAWTRSIELLKETDPHIFWQTPHYVGWEGVLIRYDSKDRSACAR